MLLNSIYSGGITLANFIIASIVSLALGALVALSLMYKNRHNQSLSQTLVMLPLAVQTVILLVNGNLGIGVAVAGAFSLVRFRSVPGTAREITALFTVMAIGLATGTGYLLIAALFTIIMCLMTLVINFTGFGDTKKQLRQLKITIPESLDYENLFDDILAQGTEQFVLTRVRTTAMGSLYELSYDVVIQDMAKSRIMLDEIRTRNGNLNISLGRQPITKEDL